MGESLLYLIKLWGGSEVTGGQVQERAAQHGAKKPGDEQHSVTHSVFPDVLDMERTVFSVAPLWYSGEGLFFSPSPAGCSGLEA